jgi:hypothetical protein
MQRIIAISTLGVLIAGAAFHAMAQEKTARQYTKEADPLHGTAFDKFVLGQRWTRECFSRIRDDRPPC